MTDCFQKTEKPMKKRKIYLSTFSKDAEQAILQCGIGTELNQTCISTMLDEENIGKTIEEMQGFLERTGTAENALLHGPYTEVFPQAIDPMMAAASKKRLNQAAYCAIQLGIKRMVVHSGYIPFVYFPVWHVEKSVSFWKDFLSDKPADFQVLIENVLDDDPHMQLEIAEKADDPRIRLCLDVGHANVATKPEYPVTDWIRILGPYLQHFHLHNNDGKNDLHRPFADGDLDMEEIMSLIDAYCPEDATVTVESYECEESIRWLQSKMK